MTTDPLDFLAVSWRWWLAAWFVELAVVGALWWRRS